jgi:hypothetical protein
LKRLRVRRASAAVTQVIPGPEIGEGQVPFDGIVDADGSIVIVADRGRTTDGRFRLYRHAAGTDLWSIGIMDTDQVSASIRESFAQETGTRLRRERGRLVLRDDSPWSSLAPNGAWAHSLGRDRAGNMYVEIEERQAGGTLQVLSPRGRLLAIGHIPRTVTRGGVMLETGARDKLVWDDGSLIVLAWSEQALTIYRLSPPPR